MPHPNEEHLDGALLEKICSTRPAVSVLSAVLPREAVPRLVVQRVIGRLMPHSSIDAGVPHLVLDLSTSPMTHSVTLFRLLERVGGPPLPKQRGSGSVREHPPTSKVDDHNDTATVVKAGNGKTSKKLSVTTIDSAPTQRTVKCSQAQPVLQHRQAPAGAPQKKTAPPTVAQLVPGKRCGTNDGLSSLTLSGQWPADVELSQFSRNLTELNLSITPMAQVQGVGTPEVLPPSFVAGARNVKRLSLSLFGHAGAATTTALRSMIGTLDVLSLSTHRFEYYQQLLTRATVLTMETIKSFAEQLVRLPDESAPDTRALEGVAGALDMSRLASFEWRADNSWWSSTRHSAGFNGAVCASAILVSAQLGGASLRRLFLKFDCVNKMPWTMVRHVLRRSPNLEQLTLSHFEPGSIDVQDLKFGAVTPAGEFVSVLLSLKHLTLLHLPMASGAVGFSDVDVMALLLPPPRAHAADLENENGDTTPPSGHLGRVVNLPMSDDQIVSAVSAYFAHDHHEKEPPHMHDDDDDVAETTVIPSADFESVPLPHLTNLDLSGHHALSHHTLAVVKARAAVSPLMAPFLHSSGATNESSTPADTAASCPHGSTAMSVEQEKPRTRRRKEQRSGLHTVKLAKVWPRAKETQRHAATTSIDVSITV